MRQCQAPHRIIYSFVLGGSPKLFFELLSNGNSSGSIFYFGFCILLIFHLSWFPVWFIFPIHLLWTFQVWFCYSVYIFLEIGFNIFIYIYKIAMRTIPTTNQSNILRFIETAAGCHVCFSNVSFFSSFLIIIHATLDLLHSRSTTKSHATIATNVVTNQFNTIETLIVFKFTDSFVDL